MIPKRLPLSTSLHHTEIVNALSWSPDSRYLATAGSDDTVRIWHVQTAEVVLSYARHTEAVEAVSWSPAGAFIASAGWDKTVHVWHAQTGEVVTIYHGHTALLRNALVWSPDGSRLASGGWDRTVHVWHAESGARQLVYQGHQSVIMTLAWSPDGRWIASGGGCVAAEIQVWDAENGIRNFTDEENLSGSVRGVAWSPDSRSLATIGLNKEIRRLAFNTGQVLMRYDYTLGGIHNLDGREVPGIEYGSSNIVWSPDGTYLATATNGTGWAIWDAQTGENLAVSHPSTEVLAWSPDGKSIACAYDYKPVVSICRIANEEHVDN